MRGRKEVRGKEEKRGGGKATHYYSIHSLPSPQTENFSHGAGGSEVGWEETQRRTHVTLSQLCLRAPTLSSLLHVPMATHYYSQQLYPLDNHTPNHSPH